MRDYLRSLPVFGGVGTTFDTQDVPDSPVELFGQWLRHAVEEGEPEPHAMTLSTQDGAGRPDGRVLILKDLDARGWWFASNAASDKGVQLSENPAAALTFYWPRVARQVRVRGTVDLGTAQRSAADFRSRGRGARAVALASRESQPLTDRATCARAVEMADRRLAEEPDLVAADWQTYVVVAETVEFWCADKDRQHVRLRYRTDGERWTRILLWP